MLDNLKEIAEYIGHTSEAQARVFLRQVVALAEAILRQPELVLWFLSTNSTAFASGCFIATVSSTEAVTVTWKS